MYFFKPMTITFPVLSPVYYIFHFKVVAFCLKYINKIHDFDWNSAYFHLEQGHFHRWLSYYSISLYIQKYKIGQWPCRILAELNTTMKRVIFIIIIENHAK